MLCLLELKESDFTPEHIWEALEATHWFGAGKCHTRECVAVHHKADPLFQLLLHLWPLEQNQNITLDSGECAEQHINYWF